MNGALRVLRQEVRRLLPLVLAMGVVTAVLIWTHPSDWGTRWNSLGATLREDVIIIGPACVVVGVWCGGSVRRAAMGELLASTRRSALACVAVDLAALVVVLYLGVLIGWASAAWTIVLVGGWGSWVAVWYVLGLLPVVAAYGAAGYAVGRLVPWRIAAPVAGLATYVGFGFGVYRDFRLEQSFGSGLLGGTDGQALMGDVLIWSGLGLLLVAIAASALAGVERRPAAGRWWIGLAVVGMAGAVLPFASVAAQPDVPVSTALVDPPLSCSADDGPRVCVLEEQRVALPAAARQARAVIDRFGGVAGAPTRARVGAVGQLPDDTLPMTISGITPWGRIGGGNYASEAAEPFGYLDPTNYCTGSRSQREEQRLWEDTQAAGVDLAASWLSGERAMVGLADPVVEKRFAVASRAQRQRFAGRLALAAHACDLPAMRAAARVLPPLPDP